MRVRVGIRLDAESSSAGCSNSQAFDENEALAVCERKGGKLVGSRDSVALPH